MKYVITESQQDNLLSAFNQLMNSTSYKGVCRIWVDYDEIMDRYLINVFFSKDYLVNVVKERTVGFLLKTINLVTKRFFEFTGLTPFVYHHIDEC